MTATTTDPTEVIETEETPTGQLLPEGSLPGTEGTNEYKLVAESSFGALAYRLLGAFVRFRLEPATEAHTARIAEVLTRATGWKQPGDGDQDRFSIVLPRGITAVDAFEVAYALVKKGRPIKYYRASLEYETDLQAPVVPDSDFEHEPAAFDPDLGAVATVVVLSLGFETFDPETGIEGFLDMLFGPLPGEEQDED